MGRVQLRRAAAACLALGSVCLALGCLLILPSPARSEPALTGATGSPAATIGAYVAALDHRRWGEACALLVPEARDYFSGPDCAAAYRRRFSDHLDFEPHWTRTRILRADSPVPSGEFTAVDLRVALTYVCPKGVRSYDCPSGAGTFSRPDRIYLRPGAQGWLIARGGQLTETIGGNGPFGREEYTFPPATPASLGAPATGLAPPPFACPSDPVVGRADDPGDVQDGDYQGVDAPWLDIRRLALSRIDSRSACLSVELADAPRPDTHFWLHWMRVEKGKEHGGGGDTEIVIDGTGVAHATSQSWGTKWFRLEHRPRLGFVGDTLQVELNRSVRFDPAKTYALKASVDAEPTFNEPLLPSALVAQDESPESSCLLYPSGKLIDLFMCQGPSG